MTRIRPVAVISSGVVEQSDDLKVSN